MKRNNLLPSFEYAIMPAPSCTSLLETPKATFEQILPLMHVSIDFEKGKFFLEGDWCFLLSSNGLMSAAWHCVHNGRVEIEGNIFPAHTIDLADGNNDGLICTVEGVINDNIGVNGCTGFIVIDKINRPAMFSNHEWNLSFYVYDFEVDNCEIKFKLPVYTGRNILNCS